MATVQDKIRKFQWIKGDNFGKIVELDFEDSKFLNFKNGTKIFKNIQNEFLKEIINDVIPLPGADSIPKNNADKSTKKKVKEVEVVKEPSVMGKMITKLSKKNVVNVPIQINLNIPTIALHAMLSEGMESDDLSEEIMEVALSQIEMDKLQDYVKSNIGDFLKKYYS
jgi:hypothetical protein